VTRAPAGADLWLLEEAAIATLAGRSRLDELLAPDEQARHERLRHPQARLRFLGGRLLLRHALSAYEPVEPGAWRFRLGEFGRPQLEPNVGSLAFNLAHTDGLVACLVTRGRPCGVDVERKPARPGALRLAGRWFADEEREHLEATPAETRGDRFLDYWVLKEAYVKALGLGLTRRLDSFSFGHLADAPISVRDGSAAAGEAERWQFELLPVGPDHVVAVAVRREPAEGPLPLRVVGNGVSIGA
jgi:4'-phosphopantetheinyl transferase